MVTNLFVYKNMIPASGVHCIGNGRVAMYGDGADILRTFGPCYS